MPQQSNESSEAAADETANKAQQAELQAAMNDMVEAFNVFHAQLEELKHAQEEIKQHIRQRVDQQKIDHVRQTLNSLDEPAAPTTPVTIDQDPPLQAVQNKQ